MGIIKKFERDNCVITIWDIEESYEKLLELSDDYDLSKYKSKNRKKEILASRLLLNEMHPNQKITYNEYGSPQIKNGHHISISHSENLVALASSDKKIGIDIEKISSKPLKLSSKFINKESFVNLSKEKATLIWCIKEAIFKWHQEGNIDFINDIVINPFSIANHGDIIATFNNKKLSLKYKKIDSYFLVYLCN